MADRTVIRPPTFDEADMVEYRPGVSGNWTAEPRSVQQALDDLAANSGGISGMVDNMLVRGDGTTAIQTSGVTLDDNDALHLPTGGNAGIYLGDTNDAHWYSLSDTTHIFNCGTQTAFTGTMMILGAATTLVSSTGKLEFRDTGLVISSSADGQLDIDADSEVEITAPIVDVNASTGLALDGANLNSDWTVNLTKQICFGDSAVNISSPSDGDLTIASDGTLTMSGTTQTVIGEYGNCDFGESGGTVYDFRPAADVESDLGSSVRRWRECWVDELHVQVSTADVSSPPTDAQLDTAFGTPGTLGEGFVGLVDDNNAEATVWLCAAIGSTWWYTSTTKAV